MKKIKYVIIAAACICLICLGFYSLSKDNGKTEKELTEVEKIITRDLDKNYPKTPREVMKFYNRIMECYYGVELKDTELEDLIDQVMLLLDKDLLLVNPREEYRASIIADIEKYKNAKKTIVSSEVSDSNDVNYVDDVKEGAEKADKLAYVNTSYFINTKGEFAYTYQQFVLRQDENGRWKILTFYEVEGDPLDN